jgi:hypothetical protein
MIKINLDKAREITHEKRRIARSAEFAPYDELVTKQIPGEIKAAEKERKGIRTKYETLQEEVDAATSVEELKSVMEKFK